jgi:hypothetical protein
MTRGGGTRHGGLALALGLAAVGCATTPPPPAASPPTVAPELRERAAALFEAAGHHDVLRLKTLVDWSRFRLVEGLAHAGSDEAAAVVLSRLEAEPEPSARLVEAGARALEGLLAPITTGPTPPQLQAGTMNATLAAWRRGPQPGAPAALARLTTLVSEALDGAREVTYAGSRRVTFVFVGDRLAGVLEAP